MNDKFRIVLSDDLLPVQAFFNAIPDDGFIKTLNAFKNGVGAGFNETYCGFPGSEDFDEEPLNGIEFALLDEEVILSYDGFYNVLTQVCNTFINSHPDKKDEVDTLCGEIRDKLDTLSE